MSHGQTRLLVARSTGRVYVRHSSIRSDIVPDTKNLAGLVPRIGAVGIRENDINIPIIRASGRETEGMDRRRAARNEPLGPETYPAPPAFEKTGEFRAVPQNRSNFAPRATTTGLWK